VFYASAIGSWTEITDTDFTGLTEYGKMEFLDGFAFVADGATGRIHNSNVNSLSTWSANDYITKSISQDFLVGLGRINQLIVGFGLETMECYRNAGNATGSPLVRVPELTQSTGLIHPDALETHYYATLGNRMYFVGRSGGRSFSVYSFDGGRVEKVSTRAVDKILNGATLYSVTAFSFHSKPAIAISLTSTTETTQRWLMFVPEWNDWFEWTSTVFTPVNNGRMFLGVGTNQHRVYDFLSTSNWQDNGTNYDRVLQFKLPSKGNQRKFMRWCGLIADTERTAATESVQFSDDDGQTWSTARTIDRAIAKKHIYRCGSYSERMVRLTNGTNHEGRIEQFIARVD
jgi:hypothetical protein